MRMNIGRGWTNVVDKVSASIGARSHRRITIVVFGLALTVAGFVGVASGTGATAAETARTTAMAITAISNLPLGQPVGVTAATTGLPTCPSGQLPWIHETVRANKTEGGAPSVDAALRTASPGVGRYTSFSFAPNVQSAPVWIVAGNQTFVANMLSDGTWFVSPATFKGCGTPPGRTPRKR